jgi:hypothetical protein
MLACHGRHQSRAVLGVCSATLDSLAHFVQSHGCGSGETPTPRAIIQRRPSSRISEKGRFRSRAAVGVPE